MTTAAATRETSPSAANPESTKLQKMLDLEYKRKMERIHGSSAVESPPPSPTTTKPPSRQSFQPGRTEAGRPSPDMPNLSIIVPSSPADASQDVDSQQLARVPQTPPKQPLKTVTFLPNEKGGDGGDGDDDKSDTSSICQSPSWEGYGQRKKDKRAEEKQRRKAKEQAEKNSRDSKKRPTARLTKHPPSASRTHLVDKSASTPALPEQDRSRRASTHGPDGPTQSAPQTKHRRRRSSSIASQIRAALTGHSSQQKEGEKEVGFVGGLKLEKEREAAALKSAGSALTGAPPGPQKSHSFGPEMSASASASAPSILPRAMSDFPTSSATPLRHNGGRDIQMRKPVLPEDMSSTSPALQPSHDEFEAKNKLSQGVEDIEEPSRGRRLESYVKRHRRQSQERAISSFNDENKVNAKSHYPPQANRQHYTRTTDPAADPTGDSRSTSIDSTARERSTDSVDTLAPSNSASSPVELHSDPATKTARGRRRSRELSIGSSRGFRDAMQAALQRVRSSSRPPASSAATFGHQPGYAPPKSDQTTEKTTVVKLKVPELARPSSSSSSCCDHSLRLPSSTTTPDSRSQSDKELPPVVGEVGQGTTRQGLVDNDERVFLLPQRATLSSGSGTATPGSPASQDRRTSRDRGHETRRHAAKKFSWESLDQGEDQANNDSDSYKTCESDGSQTSPISSPKIKTVARAGQGQNRRSSNEKTRESKKPSGNVVTAVVSAPSLSMSRSSPNVTADAPYNAPPRHRQFQQDAATLVPPPRPRTLGDSTTQTSSVSLPDALTAPAPPPGISFVSQQNSIQDPSAYLQKARKSAPAAAVPRSAAIRVSGGGGSGGALVTVGSCRPEGEVDPVAKMFVECCGCKFFHDMPSRVYECMANPDAKVEDPKLGVSGAITTVVNCPWCKHGMTTRCCAGYAAVVYLKERLH